MGITASQIRQDLNCFGGFGQQGYGYNVEYLYKEIGNILGVNEAFKIIIIGAGNMGQALANYTNFEKRGFKLIGIFDINPNLIGKKIRDVEIMHLDSLTGSWRKIRLILQFFVFRTKTLQQWPTKWHGLVSKDCGISLLWI